MTITTQLLLRHEYEFKYHYLEEIILPGLLKGTVFDNRRCYR